MSIKRITISVPEKLARKLKKAAGAQPVSAWVTEAIEERLTDVELEKAWEAFCADVPPNEQEKREAEESVARILAHRPRERSRGRGAA